MWLPVYWERATVKEANTSNVEESITGRCTVHKETCGTWDEDYLDKISTQ